MAVSWLKKSNRILSLEDRGALPEEDGNQLRECRAVHEELSQQLAARGCGRKKKAEMGGLSEEAQQQESKSGKREAERRGKG